MAKYDYTALCGHSVTVSLFGKYSERERTLDYLREKPCRDCQKAEMRRVHAEENAAATEKNRDLPRLTGSEKQIAWAESIRAKFIPIIQELKMKTDAPVEYVEILERLKIEWIMETRASQWIEMREWGEYQFWAKIEQACGKGEKKVGMFDIADERCALSLIKWALS